VLKLSIVNLNNGARYDYYNKFTKNNCTDPENIMILSEDGNPLLEKNYVYTAGSIYLRKGCDQGLTLKAVKGGMGLPAPPFGTDDFASKNNYTTFAFNIEREGDHYNFSDLDKGVYLVSTGENAGVLFYHFNKWYPNCNDTSGFYEPLVYISSRDEYEAFKSANSTKVPFENFWLAHAGDKVAARKAINEYFKRVFEANADYTAVQEGWRTDRGMVYIVFGKPGYVEKQLNKEIWIYNTPFNTSLSFTFNKIDNPYSDNDYRLERDMRYKPQWYNAVENWRRGKPFNLNGM
jgi:GWxTD domain-containing protein